MHFGPRYAITDPYSCITVGGETDWLGRSIPAEEYGSGLPPTHSGVANRQRLVRRGMVPNRRRPRLRPSEHAIRTSCFRQSSAHTSTTIFARGTSAISYPVAFRGSTYSPVHQNRFRMRNRAGGPQSPRGGPRLLVTSYAKRSTKQAKKSEERQGAAPSQISSTG